jgi:hypothetical protein
MIIIEKYGRLASRTMRSGLLMLAALAVSPVGAAMAGPVRSVGIMTFASPDILVLADWRGGEIHALSLPAVSKSGAAPFNLKDISAPIAAALHTTPENLRFEDMAFRPGSELAYITLSILQGSATPRPALVAIDTGGKVDVVDLVRTPHTSAQIRDEPSSEKDIWHQPEATYTVTDMVYSDGKLFVAGLSNASFASTLRVYDFPFTGGATATSVEMYHAVHNQLETRAPIRKMAVVSLNGEPTLLAAYTCTPLVTIPIKDLKDGAHIKGKTIAELGWGSMPVSMVTLDIGQGPMVLLVNSHKSADLLSVAAIAGASTGPGLSTPIKWPSDPLLGPKSTYIPMPGVAKVDTQDDKFLGALRRNEASGAMELVSLHKGAFLRLSDFVNEYDFADFKYGANDPWRSVHQMLRTEEGFPDLAARAAQ